MSMIEMPSKIKLAFLHCLTLLTLSNLIGLFHSLFWIQLKRSVGVKGLNLYSLYKTKLCSSNHYRYQIKFVIKSTEK